MKYVARVTKILIPGIHSIGGLRAGKVVPIAEFPAPDRVEIEPEPGAQACMMYRYTDADEFCGDTWHETLEDAFGQAKYEYGLLPQDFRAVYDG